MTPLVKAAVDHPVSTLMVFSALVLVGILGATNLGLSAIPEVKIPRMVISTSYQGLPAGEVRSLITIPLEGALASVRGLKHLESVSREGVSSISLEFQWGTDLRMAAGEVRQTLEASAPFLPSGAGKPRILPVDPADVPLAVVGLVSRIGDPGAGRRLASLEIRTRLQEVKGVGTVVMVGGAEEELFVSVDRRRLQAWSLTPADLARQISGAVCDFPAGILSDAGTDLPVKVRGGAGTPGALERLPVRSPGGAMVEIQNFAVVGLGPRDQCSSFTRSGVEGTGFYIHKQPGANPVDTMDGVHKAVLDLGRSYGSAWEITVEFDGTGPVLQGLRTLGWDVLLGILAAFVVLYAFIRDRSGAWAVMVSVPVSLVLTLGILGLAGRSLNLLSLGGIALSLGAMVDHGVVIVENLHRRTGATAGPRSPMSVVHGTLELSLSNLGSTGTSVLVFLPVVFLPGPLGSVFTDLSVSVIGAHLASFLVSVTLVPVIYLLVPPRKVPEEPGWLGSVRRFYLKGLAGAFRKPLILAGVLGLTVAGGGVALGSLKFTPFPDDDAGVVDLDLALPSGTPVSRAAQTAQELENRLQEIPGVLRAFSRSGAEADDPYYYGNPSERPETVHTRIQLAPGNRSSAGEMAGRIQKALGDCRGTMGIRVPTSPLAGVLGPAFSGTRLLVVGFDREQVTAQAREISRKTGGQVFPGESGTELHYIVDTPLADRFGVGPAQIADTLRAGTTGLVAARLASENQDWNVRVRYQDGDRLSADSLQDFLVRGRSGNLVPLGAFGHFEEVFSGASFYRYDRKDACQVSLSGPGYGKGILDGDRVRDLSKEAFRDLNLSMVVVFGTILVLIYLFLGAQLGSFSLPILVMCPIPLAFSGTTAALALGTGTVNIPSLLGVVALCGSVINNSILLYQIYRDRNLVPGITLAGVVLGGSCLRLRPVLMTASITVLSLAPVALDSQGTPESGMALALLGGLSVSTVLTLFVVPLLFGGWFKGKQ